MSSRNENPFLTVKYQKGGNCDGGYIKLLEEVFQTSGKEFLDTAPWVVMFGPDNICPGTKLHFIFRHQNPVTGEFEEKHLSSPLKPTFGKNTLHSHCQKLMRGLSPDNTYNSSGLLLEDFTPPVNPAKEIDDPEDKNPEDWVNEKRISDPDAVMTEPYKILDEDAVKPEGWLDDAPVNIPDPDAEKPKEWDDEEDGDWIAPTVPNPACDEAPGCSEWKCPYKANPAYKGKWYAHMIDNPAYIAEWAPCKIANPDFCEDLEPVKHPNNIAGIGVELWTMTEDILFNNTYVGHSIDDAKSLAAETYKDVSDEGNYYIPLFLEDPISHIRGKIAQFLDATREEPLSAIKAHPETGVGLAGVVFTLFGMLAALFGLIGSQQMKPVAKAKKTDTSTPDDKQKTDSTPVAPAGGEKKDAGPARRRK
ncbi:Calreticulin-domain-containing protein [Suillus cothurnatus]|nr:Calreticulin-domain-containing protein [Suillus cothurnatus]